MDIRFPLFCLARQLTESASSGGCWFKGVYVREASIEGRDALCVPLFSSRELVTAYAATRPFLSAAYIVELGHKLHVEFMLADAHRASATHVILNPGAGMAIVDLNGLLAVLDAIE